MMKLLKLLFMPVTFNFGDGDSGGADGAPASDATVVDGEVKGEVKTDEPADKSGADELSGKETPEQLAEKQKLADEEAKNAEGMKVPETADGYNLPVPEGQDGTFAKEAANWFHEAGIPPVQAEKLANKWNEYVAKQGELSAQAAVDADKQAEATFTEQNSALKKEWGDKYDGNIELGKRAVKQFEVPIDILDAIEAKVGPAGLFKFFAKIGNGLGEDNLLGITSGSSTGSGTGAETLYPAHYKQ